MLRNVFGVLLALFIGCIAIGAKAESKGSYHIGVYYFPGWKDHQVGGSAPLPWERIKLFPDREPLLGWYAEGDVGLAEKQIQWMHDYGIQFVIYDWYWTSKKEASFEHALSAYFKAKNNNLVKFSLLWANHSKVPQNLEQFTSMVSYWIDHYFKHKQYLTVDGKPVVFVFSQEILRNNAKKFGKTTKDLLDIARTMAIQRGLPGIYFVGSAEAVEYWVKQYVPEGGYDAFSAYNYHRGFSGKYIPNKPASNNYEELMDGYEESWNWIVQNAPIPYMVPLISGWDSRPWGGNTPHDMSFSTPKQFELHLQRAKRLIDKYPQKTLRTAVICCWNEYGEGSYIEPTKKYQFAYLEAVKRVFGRASTENIRTSD